MNHEQSKLVGRTFTFQRLVGFALVPLWAVWWAGLTFYAAVVVPIGTELFGSVEQGFLTQQVTNRLNQLGWIVLALFVALAATAATTATVTTRGAAHSKRASHAAWLRWALVLALAIVQCSLVYWHGRLDALLDPATRTMISDEAAANFYGEHRVYLVLTTLQWLLGLATAWACENNKGDGGN